MQVKMKSAKVFEVIGRTGKVKQLKQVGNDWNNMVELQTEAGLKLILMREGGESGVFAQAFSDAVGDRMSDWTVVSGAPSLLYTLDNGT